MKIFRVGNSIKYIAWGGFFLSALTVIGQITDPKSGILIVGIIFSIASLYLIDLSKSNLIFTEEYVMLILILGKRRTYVINWAETQGINTDGHSYILTGNNKALTFSTFMTSRQEKKKIEEELGNYATKHNISILWQPEIITKMTNTEILDNNLIK